MVESTKATWLTGTGFEHNTLYNYNLHNAINVYAGLQQTETAYWQGAGSQQNAPGPWTALSLYGNPDFLWCAEGDQSCRMGLAQNIDGGSNLELFYASGKGFMSKASFHLQPFITLSDNMSSLLQRFELRALFIATFQVFVPFIANMLFTAKVAFLYVRKSFFPSSMKTKSQRMR